MNAAGEVRLVIDGRVHRLEVHAGDSLLRAVRDAGVTSAKGACEAGECGSCSLLVDGELVDSCMVPALTCDGATVLTVASLLSPDLAAALARHGAVQCGFCTPGIVVAAEAALRSPSPPTDRDQWITALTGNLCRCTGYLGILEAVQEVAAGRRSSRHDPAAHAVDSA